MEDIQMFHIVGKEMSEQQTTDPHLSMDKVCAHIFAPDNRDEIKIYNKLELARRTAQTEIQSGQKPLLQFLAQRTTTDDFRIIDILQAEIFNKAGCEYVFIQCIPQRGPLDYQFSERQIQREDLSNPQTAIDPTPTTPVAGSSFSNTNKPFFSATLLGLCFVLYTHYYKNN